MDEQCGFKRWSRRKTSEKLGLGASKGPARGSPDCIAQKRRHSSELDRPPFCWASGRSVLSLCNFCS